MRDWLLIAHGDDLSSMGRVSVQTFRSWDQDEPAPGDLEQAIDGLLARRDVRLADRPVDLVLVPLDGAKGITVAPRAGFEVVSTGSYDLGVRA